MTPGEVYWIDLPALGGREQAGRRPAIVLQDDGFAIGSPLVLVVPLTTAAEAVRFPGTVAIAATSENGLTQNSFALVFQIRAVDRRRVGQRLGSIAAVELQQVFAAVDGLTGRPTLP